MVLEGVGWMKGWMNEYFDGVDGWYIYCMDDFLGFDEYIFNNVCYGVESLVVWCVFYCKIVFFCYNIFLKKCRFYLGFIRK